MASSETRRTIDVKTFTPAERIKQMNDIDKVFIVKQISPELNTEAKFQDVAKLLQSAGLAIKSLTNSPPALGNNQSPTADERKAAFTSSTSQYFSLLSSINVRLRRQIFALEEADIIPAEAALKDTQTSASTALAAAMGGGASASASASSSQASSNKGTNVAGGLGNLDVGWLNSRSDVVGKEMEAEIWAQAKKFLQTLEQEQGGNNQPEDPEDEGEDMKVDGGSS
ncbi:MAG: hypothetical protein M1827_000991 [Pycnora praestabilis]|nr:MAG: hypothetical protein M1827_000991 [Pycnora praestabilis]